MRQAESVRSIVAALANALIAVTLAPRCAACDSPLDEPIAGCVCTSCWADIPRTGTVRWTSSWITTARAGGDFDGRLRQIIHAFKYDRRRSLAAPLAAFMSCTAADVLLGADCVVPVPLHPVRGIRRGFNQAGDLASRLDLPVVHALWRTRRTSPQSGLTAAARRHNVRNAFTMSPLWTSRRGDRLLRNRTVVLVDDVRTTGETLNACARVLLERAGAREVRAVTAAARELGT